MAYHSVCIEHVSKKFGTSLRSALKYGLIDAARRSIGRGKQAELRKGEFWALQDVSLTLEPGDALGILGVNGSGKTTLLRILNGTYTPDAGRVTLRGRIGALIAAGAGFSPMLSGRENIFISGTLLGMPPADLRRRFDEIVAFAELEDFIDMPVRNYSSGMAVRLGFAIAALAAPDILLVDEVLAVGDMSFQKKCYERIHTLKNNGVTILLVSHSIGAVWSVCNKGFVLNKGCSEKGIIPVEEACKAYENYNFMSCANAYIPDEKNDTDNDDEICRSYSSSRCGTGDAFIINVEILDIERNRIDAIDYYKSFVIRCFINIKKHINKCIVRFTIDSEIYKAISVIDNYEAENKFLDLKQGNYYIDIEVDKPNLRPGSYSLSGAIIEKKYGVHLFAQMNIAKIIIKHPHDKFLYADFRSFMHLNTKYFLKT